MEEIIDKSRKLRKILLSPKHFFEEVIEEKLFSSLEKARKETERAIKSFGILVEPFMRGDCKYFCIFKSDLKKIVCCPIRLVGNNTFFIPTIYSANLWQKNTYKEIMRKRKLKRLSK